jgi:hypothetical protein
MTTSKIGTFKSTDFKHNSEYFYTDKYLEDTLKKAKKCDINDEHSSICNVRYAKYDTYLEGGCHGFLNGLDERGAQSVASYASFDMFNSMHRFPVGLKAKTKLAIKRYLAWLFNKSAFKHVFLTKTPNYMNKGGWFVVRTDVPSNVMLAAIISARQTHERSAHIFLKWCDLVDAGVDPAVAYLVSFGFLHYTQPSLQTGSHHNDAQTVPYSYVTMDAAAAFLNGGFVGSLRKTYAKSSLYKGNNEGSVWGLFYTNNRGRFYANNAGRYEGISDGVWRDASGAPVAYSRWLDCLPNSEPKVYRNGRPYKGSLNLPILYVESDLDFIKGTLKFQEVLKSLKPLVATYQTIGSDS